MSTPVVTYDITTAREDLQDVVDVIAERETPILKKVMNSGKATTNTRHEWVDTQLKNFVDQLNGAISSAATSITVDGSYLGINSKVMTNSVIMIDDELMRVTSVSGTTWNVSRGYAGSTAATHDDNAVITILSTPRSQGAVLNTDSSEFGSKDYNYTQIFSDFIAMSETFKAIDVVGSENSEALQTQRCLEGLMKQLELQLLYGRRYQDNTNATGSMFGGIDYFVPTANVENKQGADFNPDMLNALIRTAKKKGGSPDTIICSYEQKNRIENWKDIRVTGAMTQKEMEFNNMLETIRTEAGPIKIMVHPSVRKDHLFLVEIGKISVLPLNGRRFKVEKLAKTGDSTSNQVVGEYTAVIRQPQTTLFKLHNLASSV